MFSLLCRKRKKKPSQGHSKTWVPSLAGGTSHILGSKYSNGTVASVESNLGYRVPFKTIQKETNDFDESWVIEIGGFTRVPSMMGQKLPLKGETLDLNKGSPSSEPRSKYSQFRHRHLVSLIGYCDEKNEMILIYEYMENGTLKSHLHTGQETLSLSWKQRLEICMGAARGLHYLHTGYAKPVIHREVKSANILLDENFMAKVADFGLSKASPELDQTHVSTAIKGSFGYLDPEFSGDNN